MFYCPQMGPFHFLVFHNFPFYNFKNLPILNFSVFFLFSPGHRPHTERSISGHRHATFSQSTISWFQYLGFHDHPFNRAKMANASKVLDSTDFVVDSSNKCLAVGTVSMPLCPGFHKNVSFAKRTNQIAEFMKFLDTTTLCMTRYAASLPELISSGRLNKQNFMHYFSYNNSKWSNTPKLQK